MSLLDHITITPARPLPVILMADISGSMAADGKIDALNSAIAEMLDAFAEEDAGRTEIQVAVVTFGGVARLHVPLTRAKDLSWAPMRASGQTPMGAALELVASLLEDRNSLPHRAYRPTVVLVSDGIPTDEWRTPLRGLLSSERAAKAQRFALGVGADADRDVLQAFLDNPTGRVFAAHEAREIAKFFQWVTVTVTHRSRSVQPNRVDIDPLELDDYGEF